MRNLEHVIDEKIKAVKQWNFDLACDLRKEEKEIKASLGIIEEEPPIIIREIKDAEGNIIGICCNRFFYLKKTLCGI